MAKRGQKLAQQPDAGQVFVPYMNLGMGLNTRKDAHALQRSELARLINAWYTSAECLGKRPGVAGMVTQTGATGFGDGFTSMVSARFGDQTWLIGQTSANDIVYAPAIPAASGFPWVKIGTVSGGFLRAAEMYDPDQNTNAVFLVTGQDVPQVWLGPQTQLQNVKTGPGYLPTKAGSTTLPITPAFVATLGNNSLLFYAGDKSAPSAVYISDAAFPEQFNTPAMQITPFGVAGYTPAVVGNNDGVNGGDITGLQTMGSAMLIFKESAIYAMVQTQLLGDFAFQVVNISPTVGCLSPSSIVAMDGFVCFLAIDGIYATDGNTAQQISGNVPTYFDSTVLGRAALIANRTTALAYRHGTRYCVFFDTGSTQPDTGVWFDFAVQGDQGLPAAGEMVFSAPAGSTAMTLGGACTLRGGKDDGNVAIAARNFDFVGKFGLGFSDIALTGGVPTPCGIAVDIVGKADFFEDSLGIDAPMCIKNVDQIHLLVSIAQTLVPTEITFGGNVITDVANLAPITALAAELPALTGPKWGSVAEGGSGYTWGSIGEGGSGQRWTQAPSAPGLYFDLPILSPQNAWGKIIQMEFTETSELAWVILGYALQVSKTQVVA